MFLLQLPVLQRWLYEVYCHYNHVPFHNFQHCFMVTQMVSGLRFTEKTSRSFVSIFLRKTRQIYKPNIVAFEDIYLMQKSQIY